MGKEEAKWCGACGTLRPEGSYSKKQWKTRTWRRRCADCTESDRPLMDRDPVEVLGPNVAATVPVGAGLYTTVDGRAAGGGSGPSSSRAKAKEGATDDGGDDGGSSPGKTIGSLPEQIDGLSVGDKTKNDDGDGPGEVREVAKADKDTYQTDCPICMMPLPLNPCDTTYNSCCGNVLCLACLVEVAKKNPKVMSSCFFCKTPAGPKGRPRVLKLQKRAKKNDPHAIVLLAFNYANGKDVRRDEVKAISYLERGSELGHPHAMFLLGMHCRGGKGPTPVRQDYDRARQLLTGAADAGHTNARCELADMEVEVGNYAEAKRHFMLAAAAGHEDALTQLRHAYRQGSEGFITKEELATATKDYADAKKELEDEHRAKNRAIMTFIQNKIRSETR